MPVLEAAIAEELLKGSGSGVTEVEKVGGDSVNLLGKVSVPDTGNNDLLNLVFGGNAAPSVAKPVQSDVSFLFNFRTLWIY
jgi:hypothetical protein